MLSNALFGSIGHDLAADILRRAEAIDTKKHGQALTTEEAQCLRAAECLRKILPSRKDTPHENN